MTCSSDSGYRRIYEEVAAAILELLEPYLGGQKAKLGGPAIDGDASRAFWMDWIAQLVATFTTQRNVGFVNWHMYADWRPAGPSEVVNAKLWDAPGFAEWRGVRSPVMAQTSQTQARARVRRPSARPQHTECMWSR